jgi:hypothetical protein
MGEDGAYSPSTARSPSKRIREEAFRDLFGNVVLVRVPSKSCCKAELQPWQDLEPSDIEHLNGDEIAHYEKLLGHSSKRSRSERLARLVQLSQRNTLSVHLGGTREDSHIDPWSLCSFLAQPEKKRNLVGAAELKRYERLAFLTDNEFLSLSERRDRLVEQIRKERSDGQQARNVKPLQSLFAAASKKDAGASDVNAKAAEATEDYMFFVGLDRAPDVAKLGCDISHEDGHMLEITSIRDGLVQLHNSTADEHGKIMEGDRIIEVNGVRGDTRRMAKLLMFSSRDERLLLGILRTKVHASHDEPVFAIGQIVERRDKDEDWGRGYVVGLDPLLVTVVENLAAKGHEWDEVRQIPALSAASPPDTPTTP